jgi:hypothetical protein
MIKYHKIFLNNALLSSNNNIDLNTLFNPCSTLTTNITKIKPKLKSISKDNIIIENISEKRKINSDSNETVLKKQTLIKIDNDEYNDDELF